MATSGSRNSNIPVPPPLKLHTGELPVTWRRFNSQWANYELATDIKEEPKEKQTAIFLSCIGTEAYDLFQTLVMEDSERSDLDSVLLAFDRYCTGETNTTYELYVFNKRVQEATETLDNFMNELRRLIKSCKYGQLEE